MYNTSIRVKRMREVVDNLSLIFQRCTNSRHQVAQVTKFFFTVAHNIFSIIITAFFPLYKNVYQ